VDPEQGVDVVGVVAGAAAPAADVLVDLAVDAGVDRVDAAGGAEGLVELAEGHGEDVGEGALEAAARVHLGLRVLVDRVGDERVRQLHEDGAPAAQHLDDLAVDRPGLAAGAGDAGARVGALGRDPREACLQLSARDKHAVA
jgi:hypothetical protein